MAQIEFRARLIVLIVWLQWSVKIVAAYFTLGIRQKI